MGGSKHETVGASLILFEKANKGGWPEERTNSYTRRPVFAQVNNVFMAWV